MLGKRNSQLNFSDMDNWYEKIPKDSFYYGLRQWAEANIKDEDFNELFPSSMGRPSIPPSISFVAVFIQLHNGLSDREMEEAARFDDRVKFALGLSRTPEYDVSKSTLSRHRGLFLGNGIMRHYLKVSLHNAAKIGLFEDANSDIVDSFMIHGATSKRDTFTLIKMAMVRTLRLADKEGLRSEIKTLLQYEDYDAKGKPKINWNDEGAKRQLLTVFIGDVRRVHDYINKHCSSDATELKDAANLLLLVAEQDIEEKDGQIQIAQGTCKDRVISVTDPEMRHGHKTTSQKSDGYKGNIIVGGKVHDIITAIEVTPANAADSSALDVLIGQREENLGQAIETLMGDTAYGGADTRLKMMEKEINLIAKVPPASNRNGLFSKDMFQIDLEKRSITCPAGQVIQIKRKHGSFTFPGKTCKNCEVRSQCTKGKSGRTVVVHKEEALLQKSRQEQDTPEFKEQYRLRSHVERNINSLTAHGARKSRYLGREKSTFQLTIHAIIHNVMTVCRYIERGLVPKGDYAMAPV
jgi:hypothetical protein